ncbi:MAG: ABC transporter ATP-binding protein [Rhodothermales bacterium]|nr:ABC transporter ATP-binding protein [Rhodothermales bacterium]
MTSTVATPLVEARGATRILPETIPVTLVENIDVAIGRGELVAITGPSGSGKSSLLYLLGLLDTPTDGEVFFEGRPTHELDKDEKAAIRLAGIGFVFQFHFLLPEFTALGNVMIPMRRLGRLRPAEIRERAEGILDSLGLADHRLKRPDQLSGGQRQRVAVARALANDPSLILADEPTGSLDSQASEQVFETLQNIVTTGEKSVVAVTHDLDIAGRMGRRIHLVDGRIDTDGLNVPGSIPT